MNKLNARTLDRDELEKFVTSLDSLRCAIPDELVRHYLARAGFSTGDVRLERLIALAAQKFLADIAQDALAHSRLRSQGRKKNDGSLVLTVDDLERALREYGVTYRKPPYFADSVDAGVVEQTAPVPSVPTANNVKPNASGKPAAGGK